MTNPNQNQNEEQPVNINRVFNNPFNLDPDHEDIRIDRRIDRDIFCPFISIAPTFGEQNEYYSLRTVNPLKENFFYTIEALIFPNATFYQISVILCYIITIVFIVLISFGLDETNTINLLTAKLSIIDKIGSFYPKIIKENYWQFYRLLTFNFLHFSFPHLMLNIVSLVSYCSLFEELVKKHCFLLIFFLNGIFTNLTALMLYGKNERLCGINVGINGIFGAYIMLSVMNWEELKLIAGPCSLILIIYLLVVYIFLVSIFYFSRDMGNLAVHFISIFYGALLCALIVKPIRKQSWKLFTKIGSGLIICSISLTSLVLFILKE